MRALDDWTIAFFRLRWDDTNHAIAIPIEDRDKYHRGPRDSGPKMWWPKLSDEQRALPTPPFPSWKDLADPDTEVLVEGEFDAIVAMGHGIHAVSGTLGAGTFTREWAEAVASSGSRLTILFDRDKAGEKGALVAASAITAAGGQAAIASWPADKPVGFDVTDHFRAGGTADELRAILVTATEYSSPPSSPPFDPDEVGRSFGETPPADRPRIAIHEARGDELANSDSEAAVLDTLPFFGGGGPFVRGWSHVLAGAPKAGKTETMVRLLREWLDAGLRVVYVTEEPRAIWEARLGPMAGDWSALRVVFGLGVPAPDLLDHTFKGDEEILVFDTVRNLLSIADENDNSAVAAALNPLIHRARSFERTLILLHHERKGGGPNGEGVSGAHAILGVVDVAIELLRDSATQSRRVVRTYSRIVAVPDLLIERDSSGEIRLLGEPGAVSGLEVRRKLLEDTVDETWRTTEELRETLPDPRPSSEQVRRELTELARRREIQRDPPIEVGNARGRTHRWRNSQSCSTLNADPVELISDPSGV